MVLHYLQLEVSTVEEKSCGFFSEKRIESFQRKEAFSNAA